MISVTDIYDYATLAFAAYANDTGLLEENLIRLRMDAGRAAEFASKWELADQYVHDSGVAATVFVNIETQETHLAIRGTDGTSGTDHDFNS